MMTSRSVRRAFALFALAALAGAAYTTTINVNSSSSGSNVMTGCALRDAIKAVNTRLPVGQCAAGSGPVDTINIQVDVIATFTEQDASSTGAALPAVLGGRALNIFGKPQVRTSLASGGCPVVNYFPTTTWRLLEIPPGAGVYIADVDFSDGCPSRLDSYGGVGGAIANYGALYLTRSRLSQNTTSLNGTLNGTNVAGSAVYNGPDAQFDARDVTFDSNYGDGALYVDVDGGAGYANVGDSTFTGNSGGAIDNFGALLVTNVTFTDNTPLPIGICCSTLVGGGIYNETGATVSLSFSTLLDNSARGLQVASLSTAFVRSSLFATSAAATATAANCKIDGSVYWYGVNVSSDATCAGASLPNTDPGLNGALADNGGATQTLKLLTGSPAFHVDSDCVDAYGDAVAADQRGLPRPVRHCDAGALNDTPFFHGFDD